LPAPAVDKQLVDPALSLAIVATFRSVTEAALLVTRLEAAGIEVCTPEEYQVFGSVIPLELVTVRVAAKDYEAAKAIAAEVAPTAQEVTLLRASEPEKDSVVWTPTAPIHGAEAADTENVKLCVACRAKIPHTASLCPKCGYTQPPEPRQPTKP
jgi:ribosomal protein L40E